MTTFIPDAQTALLLICLLIVVVPAFASLARSLAETEAALDELDRERYARKARK